MSEEKNTKKTRSSREKSVLYPYYGLKESLDFARKVQTIAGKGFASEKSLAAELGVSATTKSFAYKISSARQFGLVVKTKEGVQMTARARNILNPIDPKDNPTLLLECFRAPPLYKKLIQQFDGELLPQVNSIANLMMNQLSVATAAKDRAAKVFLNTVQYCKAIDSRGRLSIERPGENVIDDTVSDLSETLSSPNTKERFSLKHEPKIGAYETVSLALQGQRTIKIVYPVDLSSTEIERVKRQIDLLVLD